MALALTTIPEAMARPWRLAHLIGAGMLGASVPLLASSQSTEGALLGLGLVLALMVPGRGALLLALAETLKSRLGLAVALMLLAWLPSVGLSLSPLESLSIWGRSVGLLLAATLIACFFARSTAAQKIAAKTLVIGALVCGALVLLGVLGTPQLLALLRGKPFIGFDTARVIKYYASAVACLAPVVLFAGFRLGGLWRYAALIYAPMALALVLSLTSGAGVLGLIAAGVVGGLVWLSGGQRLRVPALGLLALLVALGLGGIGYLFAHVPAPAPAELFVAGHYNGPVFSTMPHWLVDAHRQQIWGFSLEAALERPWFGYGLDQSNYVPNAGTIITRFNQAYVPAHPHNWLIEMLVDSGFVGLIAIVATLGTLVARWLRIARDDRLLGAAGLSLFAAFFASSLLNFSFWSTWWQTVFLVLSAILMGYARPAPRAGANASRSPRA